VNPGAARVLELLRDAEGRPCSGEALSSALDVSRTQVWKHVEALRGLGYAIPAAAGDGYRLAGVPDRLFPEEIRRGLDTRWLAREIHWLDQTDSTNRVALELGRQGAAHGTVVVAESQSAGRGRLGRSFFSPPYLNLYTSVVLRPELELARAPTLILTAAVAVAESVAAHVPRGDEVEIKWPNDVLLRGRKTSGILMETVAEAARVAFCVLGIGVNLNVESKAFPEEFRALATSLASHRGAPVDRAAFARTLYGTLEARLDEHARGGFGAVRPRFEARFHMSGRRVRVLDAIAGSGAAELVGTVRDIDADGALLVEREDGSIRRVIAGDVTLAKEDAG
jgi:BirA family transcriptional regulator, biotin operon repressor / biotin---[acetyl-CoA-carboxylase] ligase